MQVGGVLARTAPSAALRDAGLVQAQPRGALAVDHHALRAAHRPRRWCRCRRCRLSARKSSARPRASLRKAGIVGPVDLGHDRRQHRRTRRHFDHLERGAVARGDLLQRRAHGQRDVMALAVALVLVDQVDLQVADIGAAAQVVLAHQAVEGDRRGGAGIALEVSALRAPWPRHAPVLQQRVGGLQRAAFGHVDHDLEFGLVVERQHLQDHRLDHHQAGGGQHQHAHGREQQAPTPGARAPSRNGASARWNRRSRRLPAGARHAIRAAVRPCARAPVMPRAGAAPATA